MESLTCLAFNPTYSNLSLTGFHCNRVLAYLLAMMSETPSCWSLSSLPEQMMVSPEFAFFPCSCPSGFCDSHDG